MQSKYPLSHVDFLFDPKQIIPEGKNHSDLRGKGGDEDFCSLKASTVLQILRLSLLWLQPTPGSLVRTAGSVQLQPEAGRTHSVGWSPLHPSAQSHLDLNTSELLKIMG